jgi:hypothetical protein
VGIAQPIHSTEKIWQRAFLMRELGAEIIVVDQSAVHDQLVSIVDSAVRFYFC